MNLKSWAEIERGRAAALATHLGVSQPFMSEVINGEKAMPTKHCIATLTFTGGEVSLQEMRPFDWHKYWPKEVQPLTNTAQAATETVANDAAQSTSGVVHA
jgi:DNA-binding transcriptional regulator YdaS (Cro superfamily)